MTGLNFTDEVRSARHRAREEAGTMGHRQVTPDHIFLGVARQQSR